MSLIDELRRRNVIRVAIGYLAAAWLLIQIAETFWEIYALPAEILQGIVAVLVIGFIPAVISAWVFEWTPDGLVRDSGTPTGAAQNQRFDRVVMAVLALAVTYLLVDKFVVTERPPSGEDLSIAVLVFEDMSPDASQEYFSDGITEEMLNLLVNNTNLLVTSRSSVFALKGKGMSVPEIIDVLGVRYVLEGSVRKAGDTVRITAQLIDGQIDKHVWSDTYDREFELKNVLRIQDEIAGLIVNELNATLFDYDVPEVNPVAYDAWLRAKHLLDLYNPDNVELIEDILEDGLAADPDYVPLLWQKTRFTGHKRQFGLISREEADTIQDAIRAHIKRIAPDDIMWLLHYAEEAARALDRKRVAELVAEAFRRAPRDMFIVENVLRSARFLGQHQTAEQLGRYLVSRDPVCGRCFFRIGLGYMEAFEFEKAISALERALALGTGNLDPNEALGFAYLGLGEPQRALEYFEKLPDGPHRVSSIMLAYHDLGMTEKFEALKPELIAFDDPHMKNYVDAWVGNTDAVFAHLDEDFSKDPHLLRTLFQDNGYMRVMDDLRWDDLMQRLGTTPEDIASWKIDIDVPEVD